MDNKDKHVLKLPVFICGTGGLLKLYGIDALRPVLNENLKIYFFIPLRLRRHIVRLKEKFLYIYSSMSISNP